MTVLQKNCSEPSLLWYSKIKPSKTTILISGVFPNKLLHRLEVSGEFCLCWQWLSPPEWLLSCSPGRRVHRLGERPRMPFPLPGSAPAVPCWSPTAETWTWLQTDKGRSWGRWTTRGSGFPAGPARRPASRGWLHLPAEAWWFSFFPFSVSSWVSSRKAEITFKLQRQSRPWMWHLLSYCGHFPKIRLDAGQYSTHTV